MVTHKRVLVTGGCGYIGSHTLVSLLDPSTASRTNVVYSVVVVDNLVNSSSESLRRVADVVALDGGFATGDDGLSGRDAGGRLEFRKVDCADLSAMRAVFEEFAPMGGFDAAVHFAGLKAVGESKSMPLKYYEVNLGTTLTLLGLMEEYGCRSIVFSSSATVYGVAKDEKAKLKETDEVGTTITNCYGRTKYMIEQILQDFHASHESSHHEGGGGDDGGERKSNPWSVVVLRYFNPAGAHPSGKMGEDPSGVPNNLMPFVAQVAVGRRPHVTVFGNDYDTPDGTGVRDYLHVMDLADGHVAALGYADGATAGDNCRSGRGRLSTFNLGTGTGYSVLDMVDAFGRAVGRPIPVVVGPRRPGDVTIYMADPTRAKEEMGWEARKDLDDMCRDLWSWQTNNPNGYRDVA
jgi:UDP-glucose 4-epimerase